MNYHPFLGPGKQYLLIVVCLLFSTSQLNSPKAHFCPTLLNRIKFCQYTNSINHVSRVSLELSPHYYLLINDNNVLDVQREQKS